ncbi:MAG: glucose-1-phosphate adenylyltransferase subunit GlgD [Ruminococcaceae bacterium]|nr:glucose-1-phosphate adenylyltransferase subunit GlgD [Oscillospiraceae bacterium]
MNAAGIIFSNIHDRNIAELTRTRTVASVPFLCRYRLVDFALSNMVNSDIWNIGVITHSNYHSLMEHIGSGKDFDLARRSGGVKVLPPYITAFGSKGKLYNTRLEALIGVYPYISSIKEELVVLSDCDTVCNIDMRELISEHLATGADITVAVSGNGRHIGGSNATLFRTDSGGAVTDILEGNAADVPDADLGLNIMVLSSGLLSYLVSDAAAHGYTSFIKDIMIRGLHRYNIRVCRMSGYSASIGSLSDYYTANMELIRDKGARDELFLLSDRPVYTKRRNSPPTSYTKESNVCRSLIADGCVIRGTVENSVLFRGVTVGEGAVIRNSIIMQDCIIGDNSSLDYVICDKNAVIRDGRRLSGCEGTPFCITKGHLV